MKRFKQFAGPAIWHLQAELSWNPEGKRWLHHGAAYNSYTVIGIGWKVYLRIVLSCTALFPSKPTWEKVKF